VITAVAHIGIRVHELQRSLAFYRVLGFELRAGPIGKEPVAILMNDAGVEINLILNAPSADEPNILMDVPEKHPGYTHVAYRVADIRATIAGLKKNGIAITQGPVTFGDGHVSVFLRDPDRNVIELRARLDPGVAETIEGLTFYDPKG